MMTEHRFQMPPHRLLGLLGTGLQAHQITRVVVNHRERMQTPAISHFHPALEVHLPQLVRRCLLEPRQRRTLPGGLDHTIVAPEHRVHRRGRRWRNVLALQAGHEFARTPCRMRVTDRQYLRFQYRLGLIGTAMRPARTIHEFRLARRPPAQPFVAGVRMDAETTAQLPPVGTFQHRQTHECFSLLHDRHLLPWHGSPPGLLIHPIMRCRPSRGTVHRRHSAPSTAPRPRLRTRWTVNAPKPRRGAPFRARGLTAPTAAGAQSKTPSEAKQNRRPCLRTSVGYVPGLYT